MNLKKRIYLSLSKKSREPPSLINTICACKVIWHFPLHLCYHVIQAKDFLVFASRHSESRETFAVDPIKSPQPLFMVGRAEWSLNRALFPVCINLFSWSRGSEILHNKPTNYMPEWNETLRCNLINTGCRDIDVADDLSEILCVCEVARKLRSSTYSSRDSESRETFAVDPIKSPGPLFMVGRAEWSLNRVLFSVCINLFSWSRGSEILHNKPTNYMPEWNETLRCNLINTGCRDIDGADDLSEIICAERNGASTVPLFTVCINLFSWSRGSEILHNKPTNYMPEWNETLRCNLINTGCRDIDGADDLSEILCVCEVARKLRSSIYCKAARV
ncbi:hypothetical protein CEXT_734941 [Caerostris extrusa]|uniref:SWIM-type domain-containing protein n=1 Tax=Caerostris extrusa TaxID=172846 RepID=A0AAV4Y9Q8_CAEEX|nr:hypothetical protein CEXT_734941 [Caerostris extrusa]